VLAILGVHQVTPAADLRRFERGLARRSLCTGGAESSLAVAGSAG